jgi:hypothetical protein
MNPSRDYPLIKSELLESSYFPKAHELATKPQYMNPYRDISYPAMTE